MASASFRGTAPSHTQVSWNGIYISSPMLGMVDFSLIPVYIIDDLTLSMGRPPCRTGVVELGDPSILKTGPNGEKRTTSYIQGVGSYGTFDEYLQLGLGNKGLDAPPGSTTTSRKTIIPLSTVDREPGPGNRRSGEPAGHQQKWILFAIWACSGAICASP